MDYVNDEPKEIAMKVMKTMDQNLFPPYTIVGYGKKNIQFADQVLAMLSETIELKEVKTG